MGAVVTGVRFVELARLHYCVGIELCFRGLVLGFRRFLFVLSRENNALLNELERLIFCFVSRRA